MLTGRTGTGKTMLIETICGLRRSEAGSIKADGRDITHAPPSARTIGYVPQDGAIFKSMRIGRQIGFPLSVRGATAEEIEACEKYALDIGLAFQVADDILDVTASTEDLGKTAAKDLDADKTTYPKLLGLEGAQKEARRLIDEAKEALEPFGDRAAPLLAIADYIIERKN